MSWDINYLWCPYFGSHVWHSMLSLGPKPQATGDTQLMTWLVCITPSVFQVLLQLEAPVTTRNRLVGNQEQAGDSWIDSWQSGKTVTVSQSGLAPLTGSSSQAPKSYTERYPQCLPRGREDERHNDDLMTNRTTTRTTPICWCGRTFNTVRGMRIHQTKKACWSIQRSPDSDAKDSCGGNPVPGEPCKAEGTVSEDNPPIADGHAEDPSIEESAARVKWPARSDKAAWKQLDEDLSKVLAGAFKAGSLRCLASFGKIVYQYCKERFGVLEQREPTRRVDARQRSGRWELNFDSWRRLGKQHHNRGSPKLTFYVTRPERGSSLWGGQRLPGKAEKKEKENARPSSKTLTGSQRSYLRQHGVAGWQFLKENWRHISSVCTLIHSVRRRWSPCQDWRDQHTQAFTLTLPSHGWKKSQRSWRSPGQVPHQDPTESRTRCIKPAIKSDNFFGRCYDWHGGVR